MFLRLAGIENRNLLVMPRGNNGLVGLCQLGIFKPLYWFFSGNFVKGRMTGCLILEIRAGSDEGARMYGR